MTAAIPYIMAASAAVLAVSAIRQGNAAEAAANFNAQVAEQNAAASREQAAARAKQVDRENYLRLGAIRANQGKSGGTMAGSALDVLGDAAAQGELERQNVVYQGEMAARGYANTAALDRASGENAATSGYMRAGSELLSGGSGAYTAYGRLGQRYPMPPAPLVRTR